MIAPLKGIIRDPSLRITTIALFFMGFTFASTNPYLSIIAISELGFSAQGYGAVLLVNTLVATLGVIVIGQLSDQARSRKQAILASFVVGCIGFGLFAAWPTAFTFLLCLFVASPIAMTAFSQLFAVVRVLTATDSPERSAEVNSAVRAVFALSWILVPGLVGGFIAWTGRVTDAFGVAAMSYLLCIVFFYNFGPDVPRTKAPQETAIEGLKHAFKLIGRREILSRVGALALIGLSHPVNATLMPLIVIGFEGGSTKDIGIIVGIVAALEIPFMLAGAALIRKIGLLWVIVAGGVLHMIYIVALIFSTEVIHIYALCLANAAGAAIVLSLHLSYLQECLPDRPGLGTSLHSVEVLIQRGLSAGIIAGIGLLFGYTGALAITAIGGLVGIGIIIFTANRFNDGSVRGIQELEESENK